MKTLAQLVAVRPLLNADQERQLTVRLGEGDPVAREELVLAHVPLVVALARRRGLAGSLREDALQAGMVGLLKAADRFDPEAGARFAAYAWGWVCAELVRCDGRGSSLVTAGGDVTALSASAEDAYDLDGDRLHALLGFLDPVTHEVVRLRFGLSAGDAVPLSLRATAATLGISVGKVRRHEAMAIDLLRRRLGNVVHRTPLERDPL